MVYSMEHTPTQPSQTPVRSLSTYKTTHLHLVEFQPQPLSSLLVYSLEEHQPLPLELLTSILLYLEDNTQCQPAVATTAK